MKNWSPAVFPLIHTFFKLVSFVGLYSFIARKYDDAKLAVDLAVIQSFFLMLSFICCSGEDLIYTDASGSYSDWRMMQYAFLDGLAQLILATNLHALVQPILPEGK